MKWRVLTIFAAAAAVGCGGDDPPPDPPPAPPAEDTTTAAEPAPAPADPDVGPDPSDNLAADPTQATPTPPISRPVVGSATEMPWTPTDTGTVRPGMTATDVIAVWGAPVVERTMGNWTYLYYRNGCERACGTFDVVLLEGDQVVDAIVRGPGHTYAGISSSPASRAARFTPPSPAPDTSGVIG